jgi:hypothetical protein
LAGLREPDFPNAVSKELAAAGQFYKTGQFYK